MNTNTIIEETLPQAGLLEGNLAYQNDFETDKDNEFLAAIENLSGILGTPKDFLQKLDTSDKNDWKRDLCRGILEKYYEEDIH